MYLDHVTICTPDLVKTKAFLLKIFDDFEDGYRPKAIKMIAGYWLYADGKPIIHLIGSNRYSRDRVVENFHHIAFHLENYQAFRQKLDQLDIDYYPMDISELKERRLFFRTPSGLLLETVFYDPTIQDKGNSDKGEQK